MLLQNITNICYNLLQTHPAAEKVREYLKPRLSPKAQEEFQLGYFPDKQHLNLITDLVSEEELTSSGLFYYRMLYGEKLLTAALSHHNLVMPYKDSYSNIVAMVGRSVLTDLERKENKIPKYKNTLFKKTNHLFGLWRAKESIINKNYVFVVEGQFDCMNAIMNGIENCVCLGSGNMNFNQFAMLARYTDKIIMLLDNDEAGRKGAEKAEREFGKLAQIVNCHIPEGYKDLDQFILAEGNGAKEYLEGLAE